MKKKVIRRIFPFICVAAFSTAPAMPASAMENPLPAGISRASAASTGPAQAWEGHGDGGGNITLLETGPYMDADGNVTITVNTEEALVLPLKVTMKGPAGTISFTVNRDGQQIKIKPGAYTVTSATNGANQTLPAGAGLTIPDEGGAVYLDFNKPDMGGNLFVSFMESNLAFIPVGLLLGYVYVWYIKNIA